MIRDRIIVALLTLALALQGCAVPAASGSPDAGSSSDAAESVDEDALEFDSLGSSDLPYYIQDAVYDRLCEQLPDGYAIEDLQVRYVSQEYIDELEANSQENIYYGHTVSELQEAFPDGKYVFTLGEDGKTTVRAFEAYDDTYDQVVKNVAVGTGVILVCATVSAATGGTAPLVSVVFACAAKTGTAVAVSSGGIAAAIAGIATGVETNDVSQAVKAAALSGSEEFKWGAITGAATEAASGAMSIRAAGGAEEFYRATKNGLDVKEVYQIQHDAHYPLDVIEQFKSMDEYDAYKEAKLVAKTVNGRTALTQSIDLDYESELGGKTVTNLQRMEQGYAPIEPASGKPYELHHINQDPNGTLAVLTQAQHDLKALHVSGRESAIDRNEFAKIRRAFWKSYAKTVAGE